MVTQSQFKPISTLRIANRLIDAGQDRRIAEEEAEIWQDVVAFNLATKEDLEKTKAELKAEIEKAKAELKADLIKWMVGLTMGNTALLVGILKFL